MPYLDNIRTFVRVYEFGSMSAAGHGVVMKPLFEVADTPPEPIQMACLFTHHKGQDPKARLFMDFVNERIGKAIRVSA